LKSNDLGRSVRRRGLALLLVISVLLLPSSWGCAHFREPVPAFDTVSIQVEIERDKKENLEGDLEAYTTLKGVVVGVVTGVPTFAVTGAAGGLGVGLIVCAPATIFYVFCVPIAIGIGFVGGAVFGLFGGGIMGGIGGLPSETAEQITAVLGEMERKRSFDDDLSDAMHAAIPRDKQGKEGNSAGAVTARMRDFDLRQHTRDRLSIRLRASMIQSWKSEDGDSEKRTCKYRFDSERRPAEMWLEGGGGAFRAAVVDGFQTLAKWMNSDLEAFASGKEFKKSDADPKSCFREKRWYRFFNLYFPEFG